MLRKLITEWLQIYASNSGHYTEFAFVLKFQDLEIHVYEHFLIENLYLNKAKFCLM